MTSYTITMQNFKLWAFFWNILNQTHKPTLRATGTQKFNKTEVLPWRFKLDYQTKITVLIVAQPFPNRIVPGKTHQFRYTSRFWSFFACRLVAPSPSRQPTIVTRGVRMLNYGIYAHHVRCFQSQVWSYTIYGFMVPSPLQAEVKYKFLEHRGRLSFRKIKKKKKKFQVSSCLCVQWIYLGCTTATCIYLAFKRMQTLHMMGSWEGGQHFCG